MGRRKSRSKPLVTRKKLEIKELNKLPTKFDCLSCNEEGSIECTLDKKNKTGNLSCSACRETYQSRITTLTEEIDLYTQWKDELNSVPLDPHSDDEEDLDDL